MADRLVYLDSAATTQKPRQVIEALVRYYETTNANIHRGIHTLAHTSDRAVRSVRGKPWLVFIGASNAERHRFHAEHDRGDQPGGARPGAMRTVGEGDEIVLTLMEHHSNIVPWQLLARRTGAVLRYADH